MNAIAQTDEVRRQHTVVWRMYCSGSMRSDIQARYPELSTEAIRAIILAQHQTTSTTTWYGTQPCWRCGDATSPEWGARILGSFWICLACMLPGWLEQEREVANVQPS